MNGILVGNGVTKPDYDKGLEMIDFFFSHHLISYEHRLDFNRSCMQNSDILKCQELVSKIGNLIKFFLCNYNKK